MHLPQPRSKSLKQITYKHSFEPAEHASTDFGHVNIVNGEAPVIDADGWRFLYGAPGTPLAAGKFIYMNRTSNAAQKSPGRGRPGLLPPCRRAGPTGECASLGDVTMQPLYCDNSRGIAI
jgi:hypothetical protein